MKWNSWKELQSNKQFQKQQKISLHFHIPFASIYSKYLRTKEIRRILQMFHSIKLFAYDNHMKTVWIPSSTELSSKFSNITVHLVLGSSTLRCNSKKREMNIWWNSYENDGEKFVFETQLTSQVAGLLCRTRRNMIFVHCECIRSAFWINCTDVDTQCYYKFARDDKSNGEVWAKMGNEVNSAKRLMINTHTK